ncbi:MAG: helix-turn-helix domain-containing protein, partial [Calditrichia bacterium]
SGFLKSEIFEQPETAQSIEQIPTMSYHYRLEKNTDDATTGGKYEKSGLTREKAEEYLQNLKTIMEEKKPYTDSNLSLHQLSEMLEMTPHNLSEVINTGLNQNFFDYVNYFRVEKVKKDLSDDQKRYFKLLSIALDAGFNSKSSFNVIFKKQTGMTPSEYRDKVARTQG